MSLSKERDLLTRLAAGEAISLRSVAREMKPLVDQLRSCGAIGVLVPQGKRSPHMIGKDSHILESRLERLRAPSMHEGLSQRADNIAASRDSKKGKQLPYLKLDIIGSHDVVWTHASGVNGLKVDQGPGRYAGIILDERDVTPTWTPNGGPLLFVENREAWMLIKRKLPSHLEGAAIIHYEGWLSDRMMAIIAQWHGCRLWLFSDLDPVGFSNYLKLRRCRPDARMLLPQLTEQVLQVTASESIWSDSARLLPSLHNDMHIAPADIRDTFMALSRKGLAVEQELCVGLSELSWMPESE